MLSPRSVTILALVVAAAAHPALLPPAYKKPVTSLSRSELEDVQPWIKFPFFGNVLESFPHFLPTIAEASPKIENDSRKFQVIINVKEYNKKEFLKVIIKGSFIIIRGAHADVQDTQTQSSIDSQFIQTYTMPLKVVQSSITATLTSDGYLVVTAPIGSVVNKITYNEKEIPIVESGLPLVEENTKDENVVSSTSAKPLILVTPSVELLPPKPTNDEAINVGYITPTIPAISLLPPKPNEENIPVFVSAVPTELLPPKESNDENVNEPIVIPVPIGQAANNAPASANDENTSDKEVVAPTIISIPLQQQTEGQQIIVGPTYAPITNVLANDATQSAENLDSPTTEIIALFGEPVQGTVSMNESGQGIATTEQASLYTSNNIYTSAPLQDQDNILEDVKEKSETIQLRNSSFDDYTTETSPQELGPADNLVNILRSYITIEQESYTGEPEIIRAEEKINEEGSIKLPGEPESLYSVTAAAEAADIVAATTEQQQLLHKDDESELIVESSTVSLIRSDLNQNEEVNDSTTEINNIPAEFLRSSEAKNVIGAESTVEDSTLAENLAVSDVVEVAEKAITGESLTSIANVVYNEDLLISAPQTEVREPEPTISPENATNKTSEVREN